MKKLLLVLSIVALIAAGCGKSPQTTNQEATNSSAQVSGDGIFGSIDISTDDKYLVFNYIKKGTINLYTSNIDGSNVQNLNLPANLNPLNAVFSADGSKILFVSYYKGLSQPYTYLYTADWNGQNLKQLTKNQEHILQAVYSPDGQKIYFIKSAGFYSNGSISGARPRDYDIFSMNSDGTNVQQVTNYKAYELSGLSTSPDGKYLVFEYDDSVQQHFGLLDLANTSSVQLYKSLGGLSPKLYPDNKHFIFTKVVNSQATGTYQYDLYQMDLNNQNLVRVTNTNSYATNPVFFHNSDKTIFLKALNWPSKQVLYQAKVMTGDGSIPVQDLTITP